MLNAVNDPKAQRQAALNDLDRYICGQKGGRQLLTTDLEQYKEREVTNGWHIPSSDTQPIALDIVVDGDFPYSAPRVALPKKGPGGPLEWPHVESDGVLCLFPDQATIPSRYPVDVTKAVLNEALELVKNCRNGDIIDDFRDEFLSYWNIEIDKNAPLFISLITPNGPSRHVIAWHSNATYVCADNRDTLDGWLTRLRGKKPNNDSMFQKGVLVWLPQPMIPSEYPSNAIDVNSLVKEHAPDALELFRDCVATDPNSLDVIFGAPTEHGICFAAVRLLRPSSKEIMKGFRSGHIPSGVLTSRYLGKSKIMRSKVCRADHNWVHGRDQDIHQHSLKKSRVLVLGCGAIGSSVARLLAQSGINNLTLVDHQSFDWPNASRHILGASAFQKNKAIELAETLRYDFPHLTGIEGCSVKFGLSASATDLVNSLSSFDLIISATGRWEVDTLLNDLQKSQVDIPPVVYAWLEPRAAAAHALMIPQSSDSASLCCGFKENGELLLPVVNWPDDEPLLQEPACGAVFSPFGPVELTWAHALVSEIALGTLMQSIVSPTCHTWIGQRGTVEDSGGCWNPEWCDLIGDPSQGGIVVRREWKRSPDCPVCNIFATT